MVVVDADRQARMAAEGVVRRFEPATVRRYPGGELRPLSRTAVSTFPVWTASSALASSIALPVLKRRRWLGKKCMSSAGRIRPAKQRCT